MLRYDWQNKNIKIVRAKRPEKAIQGHKTTKEN
jgi:hypothetical protein